MLAKLFLDPSADNDRLKLKARVFFVCRCISYLVYMIPVQIQKVLRWKTGFIVHTPI